MKRNLNYKGLKVGFAICGSFCTFSKVFPKMEELKELGAEIVPIMSQTAYETDTRFGKAIEHREYIEEITKKEIIHTIEGAEPVGPKNMTDVMVIAPCTGNTLAKLSLGITDTSVTMAAKSHLRNQKPLILAVSTNDLLSNGAKNLGMLLNVKNVYFVPFYQDDCEKKERSAVADMNLLMKTIEYAMKGKQLQPIIF